MNHRSLALALFGWAAFSAGCSYDHGCAWCTDQCADIPKGAIPPPAGTYSCQWQTEQIGRAKLDFFVVHEYEWYLAGQQLGPDGKKHIRAVANGLGDSSQHVIVAASDNDKLNEARRKVIVENLKKLGVPDADMRVVIGDSQAEGLYGNDAVRYGNTRLGIYGTGAAGAGGGYSGAGGGLGYSPTTSGFGAGTTFGGGGFGGYGGGMGIY